LHLNFPVENIDNRVRVMPVDRVGGSWGVFDSNDFNLFTRCFRKLFRKERIHLLHVIHRFCPFGDVPR
jgi:hypothetical protein